MSASLTASVKVPISPDDAWALWMDAGRYPQWQGGVRAVREISGPVDRPGATYVLDHGPGMKRRVTVIDAEFPTRYVVRQQGMGVTDETTVLFEPIADGTLVSVSVVFEFGRVMSVVARLQPRRTITRELSREIERFGALAAREPPSLSDGQLLTVDSQAGFRVVKVLASDGHVAHVALLPGVSKERPTDLEPFLDGESRLLDPLRLRSLRPPIRRSSSLVVIGQPLFGLDGGVGVPHVALTFRVSHVRSGTRSGGRHRRRRRVPCGGGIAPASVKRACGLAPHDRAAAGRHASTDVVGPPRSTHRDLAAFRDAATTLAS